MTPEVCTQVRVCGAGECWYKVRDHVALQKSMEEYGRAWENMEEHGRICKSMEEYGRAWKNMEEHGGVWKSMEEHGRVWKSMEEHGRVWKSMEWVNASPMQSLEGVSVQSGVSKRITKAHFLAAVVAEAKKLLRE